MEVAKEERRTRPRSMFGRAGLRVLWIVWLLAVLILLLAGPSESRVILLNPDGSGDAPSFQAGIDVLLAEPPDDGPDTLLVSPGFYDEDVSLEPSGSHDVVVRCPAGPSQTEVRSLIGFSTPNPAPWGSRRLTLSGLGLRGPLAFGLEMARLQLQNCRFLDQVEIPRWYDTVSRGQIQDCEFRGRLRLGGSGLSLQGCRFVGHAARLELISDFSMGLENCVFEGGADTAVVTVTIPTDGIYFRGCVFRNVGTGIAVALETWPGLSSHYRGVGLTDCRFENLTGPAVHVRPADPEVLSVSLDVHRTRFENCASGIDARLGPPVRLDMTADTLIACGGTAIDASLATLRMDSVWVRGSGGHGADLRLVGAAGSITGCVFEGSAGHGLAVTDDRDVTLESSEDLVIERTTSVMNGGAGIQLMQQADPPVFPFRVENNLVARNRSQGLLVLGAYLGHVQHNLAWMNDGAPFNGVLPDEVNLLEDPRFCSPGSGNFSVDATSPCAPSGPFGQIGALGVGCEAAPAGDPGAGGPTGPALISLTVPSPQRGGRLSVMAALPNSGPARVEVFDVSGRRMLSRELAPGSAKQKVELGDAATLRSGLYVVRMTQEGAAASKSEILIR